MDLEYTDDAPLTRRAPKPNRPQWTNRKKPLCDVSLKDVAAQFEDSVGRTYIIITSGKLFDDYVERGDIMLSKWSNPNTFLLNDTLRASETSLGPQLIKMRLPRDPEKRAVPEPEVDGGKLRLHHTRTARQCSLVYTEVIWKRSGRDIILVCSDFIVYGNTIA